MRLETAPGSKYGTMTIEQIIEEISKSSSAVNDVHIELTMSELDSRPDLMKILLIAVLRSSGIILTGPAMFSTEKNGGRSRVNINIGPGIGNQRCIQIKLVE